MPAAPATRPAISKIRPTPAGWGNGWASTAARAASWRRRAGACSIHTRACSAQPWKLGKPRRALGELGRIGRWRKAGGTHLRDPKQASPSPDHTGPGTLAASMSASEPPAASEPAPPDTAPPAPEDGPAGAARTSGRQVRVSLPSLAARRATVIGAGSFGTALAVLLARAGLRTTLQARTAEQAARLDAERENKVYLPGVELPGSMRIETVAAGVARADYVFLAVPSRALREVIDGLADAGLGARAAIVSLAKGLVAPGGTAPTVLLSSSFGASRVACVGGPAHAHEMVSEGAGLVAASVDEELARSVADVLIRAGVVCERSNDPIGVELAGAAKNAAALAAGATEASGPQRRRRRRGAHLRRGVALRRQPGRAAGVDDRPGRHRRPRRHRARAAEPQPPRRRAAGPRRRRRPTSRARIGQAVEALESVPLLARALESAGIEAPVTSALGRLIAGELPLADWVALVRATVPPPARWRRPQPGFWRRAWRRACAAARAPEPQPRGDRSASPAISADTTAS